MKLEFHGKSLNYNLDGSLKGTIVTLGHMDGGHLPVVLPGDKTALSNQELFVLATRSGNNYVGMLTIMI